MKALIDGDLFCYRCAASAEHDNAGIACSRLEQLLDTVLYETRATEFEFFLTGENNFRYQVYPEYKANRLKEPKPKYLIDCRNYLIDKYCATVANECEADDLLGVFQNENTCIVSLDKDLLQIPGMHFSWRIEGGPADRRWEKPAIFREVTALEGHRHFYTQMLTGDSSDNIKGVAGIGSVRASKLLAPCTTEKEMFELVREAYGFDEIMEMNGKVLHIWRYMNDIWKMPNYETQNVQWGTVE